MDAATYDSLGPTTTERVRSLASVDPATLWSAVEAIPAAGETWVRVVSAVPDRGGGAPLGAGRHDD